MLPGSLLRYHEKFQGSNVVSLLQLLQYAPFVLLAKDSGLAQTQGLLIHNVEVRSVAFNTAPQFVDLMVSTLDKKGC